MAKGGEKAGGLQVKDGRYEQPANFYCTFEAITIDIWYTNHYTQYG